MFHIQGGGSLTISDATVQGGDAGSNNGGGFLVAGTLTTSRVVVADNDATDGAGIESSGAVSLTDTVLTLNNAADEGGICAVDAPSSICIGLKPRPS